MSGKAARVALTEAIRRIRQEIVSSRSPDTAIVRRAKIILMAFLQQSNQVIGEQLEFHRETVGRNRPSGTHTVCVDEMTSLQANERCHKPTPEPGEN